MTQKSIKTLAPLLFAMALCGCAAAPQLQANETPATALVLEREAMFASHFATDAALACRLRLTTDAMISAAAVARVIASAILFIF